MGTLKAGAIARLRAETLGHQSTPAPPHAPSPPSEPTVPTRLKTSLAASPAAPSADLLGAARLCRLAHEHSALIEAEDAEAQLRAAGVDDSDARKLVAWHRSVEEEGRRRELWAVVRELFPAAFGDPDHPIPLKVGIHRDLATEIGIADAASAELLVLAPGVPSHCRTWRSSDCTGRHACGYGY